MEYSHEWQINNFGTLLILKTAIRPFRPLCFLLQCKDVETERRRRQREQLFGGCRRRSAAHQKGALRAPSDRACVHTGGDGHQGPGVPEQEAR